MDGLGVRLLGGEISGEISFSPSGHFLLPSQGAIDDVRHDESVHEPLVLENIFLSTVMLMRDGACICIHIHVGIHVSTFENIFTTYVLAFCALVVVVGVVILAVAHRWDYSVSRWTDLRRGIHERNVTAPFFGVLRAI